MPPILLVGTMIEAACHVSCKLQETCDPRKLDLQTIQSAFEVYTEIDRTSFRDYDTSEENPIWGSFRKWKGQVAVYALPEIMVEIRYARHLRNKEDWLRLIITKELCHSLDAEEGQHNVSDRNLVDLVNKFSFHSNLESSGTIDGLLKLELLAEICALEILCPFQFRREYVEKSGYPDAATCRDLAIHFNIPQPYTNAIFSPSAMNAIGMLMPINL